MVKQEFPGVSTTNRPAGNFAPQTSHTRLLRRGVTLSAVRASLAFARDTRHRSVETIAEPLTRSVAHGVPRTIRP